MRKVIVSMNITLDGFMAGPNCELDWHFSHWNNEMAIAASQQLRNADTILLGRITYQAMATYWPSISNNLSHPRQDIAFAEMMNRYQKIVFSKTLHNTEWNNARITAENVITEIEKLKKLPGKNMMLYGSGALVCELIQANLVDEYILWIHPVILGKGKALFKAPAGKQMLQLVRCSIFNSGVVMHYYQLRGKEK